MRCGGFVALCLILASGCSAAVDQAPDATDTATSADTGLIDTGAVSDTGIVDSGPIDTGVRRPRDAGAPDASSCCTDLGCPTCPGGRYQIGGCGPEWCRPPFPISCPVLPETCPECASLGEEECPWDGHNILGCAAQRCRSPRGLRFVACVRQTDVQYDLECP
jgi:hypothetical protein